MGKPNKMGMSDKGRISRNAPIGERPVKDKVLSEILVRLQSNEITVSEAEEMIRNHTSDKEAEDA